MQSFDVIIIGVGFAGVLTALELPEHLNILVLSKGDYTKTNSYLAQGGIAAPLHPLDSPETHFMDTMSCGHFKNDAKAVREMTEGAVEAIRTLEGYGVTFDQDRSGYLLAMEGAHSIPRILRVGDYTGKAIMETLYPILLKRKNVHHIQGADVSKIYVENGAFKGISALVGDETLCFYAHSLVMATGGVGHLFEHTTNAQTVDGSGIALALEVGLSLKNLTNFQFHPTGFYEKGDQGRHFLISEAVRGEGAILKDQNGDRFMLKVHTSKELAPRDVVSKGITEVILKSTMPYVLLDASHIDSAYLKNRFPTIDAHLNAHGIDFTQEPIPVAPCMHYFMGGICADSFGRTNIKGIYAIGECAHTGVHGKNRLASNSLLEIAVFASKLARDIKDNHRKLKAIVEFDFPVTVPTYDKDSRALKLWCEGNFGLSKAMDLKDFSVANEIGIAPISKEGLLIHHFVQLMRYFVKETLIHDLALKTRAND